MKFRILIVLISFAFSIEAQHAYYSSLNQNLLSVNPAFAGTNDKLRVQVVSGMVGMPKYGFSNQSYYFGADFLAGKRSGLGLSFNSDIYGKAQKTIQTDLSYAFHIKLNENLKLIPALQVSYFQISLDRQYLPSNYYDNTRSPFVPQWGNEYTGIITKRNMDFSSGILLYGKRFYAGISILSFTQPDEGTMGVSKRALTQIYQGKYKFLDPEKFNIDIYGFVKLQKLNVYSNDANFIQYGTFLNYKVISIHLAQQINDVYKYDALIAGVALNLKGLRIGYNNKCNYGNHVSTYFFNEFYLQYAFGRNKKEDGETSDKGIKLID